MTFKIKASPSFHAKVKIRAPGGDVLELPVVFRHKRRDDVQVFFREAAEQSKPDADCILELVESWDADLPLSRESVIELMQEYPSAPACIFDTYMSELLEARLGN